MKVRVVILAQGSQQRFVGLVIPKQLLTLGDVPHRELVWSTVGMALTSSPPLTIIDRTLFQLYITPGVDLHVTVVCDGVLREHIERQAPGGKFATTPPIRDPMTCDAHTLPDPGNSSLKGLQRFLRDDVAIRHADAVVVLLGDVCYSWAALRALWQCQTSLAFACTPNISPSDGELFGIVTTSTAQLMATVDVAMERHSPKQVDKTYQPGMLRLMLFAVDRMHQWKGDSPTALGDYALADRPWFIPIDDYTRDFDKPADLEFLAPTARAAREDDTKQGFAW